MFFYFIGGHWKTSTLQHFRDVFRGLKVTFSGSTSQQFRFINDLDFDFYMA